MSQVTTFHQAVRGGITRLGDSRDAIALIVETDRKAVGRNDLSLQY